MMRSIFPWLAGVAMAASVASPVVAADYILPDAQPPQAAQVHAPDVGGWYLRGDIGHRWSDLRSTEYITYGCCVPEPGTNSFDSTQLKGGWGAGVGVGYQINGHLRTDLTVDRWGKARFNGTTSGVCGGVPCRSTDESAYRAWLMLANAYVDLGTYRGVTPYVGAGIGGAHLRWDDLHNTIEGVTTVHRGSKNWRFAWALMAGASYCLNDALELDLGYRYSRIAGGRMFEFGSGVGPGFDGGLDVHEARAGLRWHLGGGDSRCAPQATAAYFVPAQAPVYK